MPYGETTKNVPIQKKRSASNKTPSVIPRRKRKATNGNVQPLATVREIDVRNLLFDEKNPRHPKRLFGIDESEVINWMLEHASIIELMNSIGEQGYFEGEPLMVVPTTPTGDGEERLFVVEGNRRLTALKLLLDPSLAGTKKRAVSEAARIAKFKPEKISCQVYKQRDDLLHFLAFRHVTGIKPWDPLMKARYLYELAQTPSFAQLSRIEKHRRLAREIGSTSNYVARLFAGLAVYRVLEDNSFFGISSLEAEGDRYSVLTTAVTSYTNIAVFLGLTGPTDDDESHINKRHLKKLAIWLFAREPGGKARIPESRSLKEFNRVAGNAAALDRFENGATLAEADLLTEGPIEAFRSALSDAKSLLGIAQTIIHQATEITASDIETLQNLRALVVALLGAAKEIHNPE